MNKNVLVIGSINKDLVVKTPRFPNNGETILGIDFYTSNGGKGANQASAIAKLGSDVSILGAVGDDSFAKELLDALSKNNVNTDNIIIKENTSTGIALITVTEKGDNNIVVVQNANALISEEDIKEDLINNYDIIVLQFEIPLHIAKYAAITAKKLNKTVVLNPSPAVKIDKEFLSSVDILIPNETEINIIGGVEYILDCGVKNIIITLGANGSDLIKKENNIIKTKHFNAYKVNAVDTTAAGDTFLGALVKMLCDNKSIEEAIDFAMKAAAIAITRVGAIDSIPNYEEVMNKKI